MHSRRPKLTPEKTSHFVAAVTQPVVLLSYRFRTKHLWDTFVHRFPILNIAFVLFALASIAPALASERVALVIGNSTYQQTPKLANPRNDAADFSAALKKLGFQVIEGYDLAKAAFDRKVRDFAAALHGASAGLSDFDFLRSKDQSAHP